MTRGPQRNKGYNRCKNKEHHTALHRKHEPCGKNNSGCWAEDHLEEGTLTVLQCDEQTRKVQNMSRECDEFM